MAGLDTSAVDWSWGLAWQFDAEHGGQHLVDRVVDGAGQLSGAVRVTEPPGTRVLRR